MASDGRESTASTPCGESTWRVAEGVLLQLADHDPLEVAAEVVDDVLRSRGSWAGVSGRSRSAARSRSLRRR
jgi:hypothetical protein